VAAAAPRYTKSWTLRGGTKWQPLSQRLNRRCRQFQHWILRFGRPAWPLWTVKRNWSTNLWARGWGSRAA